MVRPRVFFDLAVDAPPPAALIYPSRIIFELFTDAAPKTAENFRALCTGEKGLSPVSDRPLYYKNSIIHRSIQGFMVQGGAQWNGGESIYGGTFPDEDLTHPLDAEGLLCMANKGPNTNGSQFFVTLRECPHLNGKHVVFGRVIRGYDVIQQVADVPTDAKDRPTVPVTIENCGELVLKSKAQSQEPERASAFSFLSTTCPEHHAPAKAASPLSGSQSEDERRHPQKRRHRRSDGSDLDHDSAAASDDDTGHDREKRHRKKSKHKHKSKGKDKSKHKKEKEREPSPSAPVPPGEETEEQYDARLEREERERFEEAKRQELERLQRRMEEREASESGNGVRFKGRGRMKYVDPELRGSRDL
ncbi:cyclophilin-like domain-containing protein [Fomitopsis serialis]|uniref:cyclophilin-like domain-containing protein n=1 Tax=Fomitopsis serialis TaxID=139415 RepID=UPI002008055A|nr:cyclophilin-like domain-containing protein [Neoantrodia serialis]KAH9925526.1 cyclophilin-like domain-containing protein [Neoantrodia serialis]